MLLLSLLFILHAFFMFSAFDIYFRSPIIDNVQSITNRLNTSTKRLVFFVGDGVSADHLYDFSRDYSKTPFLRSVVETNGSWGVSHTRVPTESRPGHVALIAGFYEDPSAVFKGWKENPVPFDSVFNQSELTLSWGSPDILPMFSKGDNTKHIHCYTYSPESQDMSGKNNSASQLDTWVLNSFEDFLNYNLTQYNILNKSRVVFFFHLLGADVAGHANKPDSLVHESTLKNMDLVVKQIYQLIEKVFVDKHTTYLFTSDHGMTPWGSHGAGSKIETETPVIAWGAGIKQPLILDTIKNWTPERWRLTHLLSHNINQSDIAVLMSVLLGISIPVHSVGVLPLDFLDFTDQDKAEAFLLNARQLMAQLKAKENQIKLHLAGLFFKPYSVVNNAYFEEITERIKKSIAESDFLTSIELSRNIVLSSLNGIDYYQTYFQNFLLACTVVSFLGVSFIILGEIFQSHKGLPYYLSAGWRTILRIIFASSVICSFILCWADALPWRFIIYLITPLTLWYCAVIRYYWIVKCFKLLNKSLFLQFLFYMIGLKLMVFSFHQRWVLSLILIALCVWPVIDHNLALAPKKYKLFWSFSCLGLAVFPVLPIVGGEEQLFFKILTGSAWFILQLTFFKSLIFKPFNIKCHFVNWIQLILTPVLLLNIYEISNSFRRGEGLHFINQIVSFCLLVIFPVLVPIGPAKILHRFNSICYSLGLTFLMFSSSYEAFFPLLLASNLLCWILFERLIALKFFSMRSTNCLQACDQWSLSSHDLRRCVFFVFYILLSFFGIGNLASLNSFDMNWVRSFITLFSPFLMMVLMLLKIILPFVLVTSAFRFVCHITKANSRVLFLIVLLLCDSMAMLFLFAIQNRGSWLDVGMSISHFVIMKSIVLFLVVLFHITRYLTALNISSDDDWGNIFKWRND